MKEDIKETKQKVSNIEQEVGTLNRELKDIMSLTKSFARHLGINIESYSASS